MLSLACRRAAAAPRALSAVRCVANTRARANQRFLTTAAASGGRSHSAKQRATAAVTTAVLGSATAMLWWQQQAGPFASPAVQAAAADEEDEDEDGEGGEKKKSGVGFRDRKVINYENRIRRYSTPDKVFRYFATKEVEGEVYMTPDDFIRSITPGVLQPDGLGLDKFDRVHPNSLKDQKHTHDAECDFFKAVGPGGLISFSEYLFFLTLLSTNEHRFAIAFRMFDLDGNGHVDINEFRQVQSVARASSASGKRNRNRISAMDEGGHLSALMQRFFGPDGKQTLTFERFRAFLNNLQQEVLGREFDHFSSERTGKLSVVAFTTILLGHAGDKELQYFRERARGFEHPEQGVSREEFLKVDKFAKAIDDVEIAFSMYTATNQGVDKAVFKRAAAAVANVNLADSTIDMLYFLFDKDGDGTLSFKEFVGVMKKRTGRGLDQSKDLQFTRTLGSVWKCAKMIMRAEDEAGIEF